MPRIQMSVVVAFATLAVGLLGAQVLERVTPRVGVGPALRIAEDEDYRSQQDDLDNRIAAATFRLSEKRSVALALVRCELSLQQAVDRFRTIIGGDPASLDYLRRFRPGATDDELLYRNVVGYARSILLEWPDLSPCILDRLQAELDAEFPAPDGHTRAGAP
jgi:hypothetical protein